MSWTNNEYQIPLTGIYQVSTQIQIGNFSSDKIYVGELYIKKRTSISSSTYTNLRYVSTAAGAGFNSTGDEFYTLTLNCTTIQSFQENELVSVWAKQRSGSRATNNQYDSNVLVSDACEMNIIK